MTKSRMEKALVLAERRVAHLEREAVAEKISGWIRDNGLPGDADAYARWLGEVLRANASFEADESDEGALALVDTERRLAMQLEGLGVGEFSPADALRLGELISAMPADLRVYMEAMGWRNGSPGVS